MVLGEKGINASNTRLVRVADGAALPIDGDLDDYAAWLTQRRARIAAPDTGIESNAPNRRDQRRQKAERRQQLQPLKTMLRTLEKDLERLSAEKARLDSKLADNTLYNHARKDELKTLLLEQARVTQSLAEIMTGLKLARHLRRPRVNHCSFRLSVPASRYISKR